MPDLPHAIPSSPLDRELKLIFSRKRTRRIVERAEHYLRPDPVFPRAVVRSLYFDTPRWHSVEEKLNSDYLKSKFRLRWYQATGSVVRDEDPVFAEAKFRIGNTRHKYRVRAPFSPVWLEQSDFNDCRFDEFTRLLRERGIDPGHRLLPAFIIQYDRRRYVDPLSGVRLCVDADIAVARTNPMMLPVSANARLETAVVEVKGGHDRLPVHLQFLTDLGCRKNSFSKYAACFQKLTGQIF